MKMMVDSTMKEGGLPEDILSEISLKLPMKSIRRFKCVSKVWESILSDPSFMQNKFKTSYIEPKPWAIFSNHVIPNFHHPADLHFPSKLIHTQLLSSCTELSGYDGFSFSFLKSYISGKKSDENSRDLLHVLSSNNGLVLCSVTNYSAVSTRYFVCNPVTEECFQLPPPPKSDGTFLYVLVCEPSSGTPSESTFVVMRTQTSLEKNSFEVETYFHDLNEWRTYNVSYLQPQGQYNWGRYGNKSNVITHNGVVYWLEGEERRKLVAAYDLKINNYGCDSHHCNVLNQPIPGEYHRFSSECLGVSEDSVCYGVIEGNTLKVLDLMEDDHSIKESVWNLRHEIKLRNLKSTKISLMGFSPIDRDVVVLDCGGRIFSYDVTTGKSDNLQRLCVPGSETSFQIQHGYSTFIVMPALTTISKARK